MNKLGAFIKLIRPINCAMMGFAVFVGAILATSQPLQASWLNILYGFFTGFLLCGAAMAINDYYDHEIDAVNEPMRPIPSGLISANTALVFVSLLTVAGLVFAYFSSVLCLFVAIASWIITVSYVTIGKRSGLPGNFLVSACVAIPFIYGSIAVTNTVQLNVLLFALMAFLSNTGREITKGIVDTKGDSAQGIKTLAVRYGDKKAAVVAAIFYVSAVALTPIPLIYGLVSIWFIPFVLVTDAGLVVCSAVLLRNYSRENARKIKKLVLLWFVFGLLAYIFGSL
ncbi:MAG: geranylgeranylglycerol-phosphate geranylgeranyltransferase [Candidatus Bathyarchaeia archaeon]|jgi:geranylgeranylglycerol-phosphate geranylgeranyltransferase